MADSTKDVNIHFRLFDDFSSAAQRIQSQTIKIGEQLERTGRQVQQFGSKLAFLGTAITGAFLVSMKSIEDASPRVQKTMTEFGNVMRNLQLSIAEAVVPAVQRLVDILAALVDAWNSVDPKVREQITQFVFMTGVVLAAVGAFLKLSGILISIVGKISTLVSWITKKNIAILLVVTAIQQMVEHWDRVRVYVLPIVRALQITGDAVAIAYLELGRAVLWLVDQALTPFINAVIRLIPILEATKVISKETGDSWRQSLGGIGDNFEAMRGKMKGQIDLLKKDMKQAADENGKNWATTLDEVVVTGKRANDSIIENIKKVFEQFKQNIGNSTSEAKKQVLNWAGLMRDTVQRLVGAMTQSLGNFFYNVFTGQVRSAKQVFVEFGQSVLRILSEVLAKILITKALGSFLGPLGVALFHSGGVVKKAHSGMYAQDEVPIVAQEGEGILSRQGMSKLGKGNLARLNRGDDVEGGSGGGAPAIVVVQAWDTQDIVRNAKTIEQIIADAMKRNTGLRGIMKQYG